MSILHHDKLPAEQVAALYGNAVEGTVGSLIAAAILSGILVSLGAAPLSAAVSFVTLVFGQSIARFALIRAYWKSRPAPSADTAADALRENAVSAPRATR